MADGGGAMVGRQVKGWESSSIVNLPCRWCNGLGRFKTADSLASCQICKKCRECGRDRTDPCGECRAWEKENRREDGNISVNGVKKRWMYGG